MARQFLIDDACKFRMLANYCGQAEVHKCFSMGSVCVPCLFAYLINLIFFFLPLFWVVFYGKIISILLGVGGMRVFCQICYSYWG